MYNVRTHNLQKKNNNNQKTIVFTQIVYHSFHGSIQDIDFEGEGL